MTHIQVPKKWNVEKLSEICTDIQPGFAQGKKNVENGIIHLRMNNIGIDFKINYELIRTVNPTKVQLEKYSLQKNDVIFNNTNSSKLVGKSAIFNNDLICLYSNHLTRIRVKNNMILPKWLLYFLQYKWYVRDFENMCNKWINQASVNNNMIRNLEIPLPEINIQKKIIQKLDYVFSQLENNKRNYSLLYDEIDKRLKILPVKNKQFLIDNIISLKNNTYWDVKRLDDVCYRITDGAHKTPTYVDDGIPFLRVKDIHDNNIDWDKTKKIPIDEHKELIKRCKPEFDDVLYSKNGTIGISKVVDWNEDFSISVSLALLKPKKDILNSHFLKYCLDSNSIIEQVKKRSKTATVTNLHLEEIREVKIPVPPISEQKIIVNEINKKLEVLEQIKSRIISLMEYRTNIKMYYEQINHAILNQAFSGKLVN